MRRLIHRRPSRSPEHALGGGLAQRHHLRGKPVSSHPEIEDEIRHTEGGLDPSQIHIAGEKTSARAIVSIHGKDVDDESNAPDRKAA